MPCASEARCEAPTSLFAARRGLHLRRSGPVCRRRALGPGSSLLATRRSLNVEAGYRTHFSPSDHLASLIVSRCRRVRRRPGPRLRSPRPPRVDRSSRRPRRLFGARLPRPVAGFPWQGAAPIPARARSLDGDQLFTVVGTTAPGGAALRRFQGRGAFRPAPCAARPRAHRAPAAGAGGRRTSGTSSSSTRPSRRRRCARARLATGGSARQRRALEAAAAPGTSEEDPAAAAAAAAAAAPAGPAGDSAGDPPRVAALARAPATAAPAADGGRGSPARVAPADDLAAREQCEGAGQCGGGHSGACPSTRQGRTRSLKTTRHGHEEGRRARRRDADGPSAPAGASEAR